MPHSLGAHGRSSESPAPTLQDSVCPPWCGTAGSTQLPGQFLGVMDLGYLGFRISGIGCLSSSGCADSCSICGATECISSHYILRFVTTTPFLQVLPSSGQLRHPSCSLPSDECSWAQSVYGIPKIRRRMLEAVPQGFWRMRQSPLCYSMPLTPMPHRVGLQLQGEWCFITFAVLP